MKKFNWQVFISFNLLFTFLIMLLSGVILYIKPEGTVSRWLDWKILLLGKSDWESLHTLFSFLFLVFALFHILKIHLPNLVNYLKTSRYNTAKELYLSLILSIVILFGTAFNIVPFNKVYEGGNYLSDYWKKLNSPPVEQIEARTTLKEFAAYQNISITEIIEKLKSNNMQSVSPEKTLMAIAEKNNLAPYEIYELIKDLEGKKKVPYDDNGLDISIAEIAYLFNMDSMKLLGLIKQKYSAKDIEFKTTLEELSGKTNKSVSKLRSEILEMIR